jgi:PAS domain S-box-containing protein
MDNYPEKTHADLEQKLDDLTASGNPPGNQAAPAPTAEELQTMLADLQADQSNNVRVSAALKAMQGIVHELQVQQVKLESQNRELHEARQELEAEHQRYVDLYDFAPNGYATLNEKGVIREINLPGAQMLGQERSRLIGQPLVAHVAKGEARQLLEHLQRCQQGEATVATELTLKGKRARTVQLLSILAHDKALPGHTYRTALIDISARRQAEKSQRASEEFSLSVLGSLSAQIAVLDNAGTIIAVNEAWTRFTLENGGKGHVRGTGRGVNYLEICRGVAGEERGLAGQTLAGIQAVLDGAQPHFALEYPCHSATQQRWFTMSVSPLLRGTGGVVVTHVEITERKLAEIAVRESEARLTGILNSAMDAIITTDAKQRIILFNTAAEQLFRCPAQAAIGQPLEKFMPARYRQPHTQHVSNFSMTETTKRRMGGVDFVCGLRADGEEFPMESSISQVEIGGQKFFTVIHRDITERKLADDKLRASEEKFRAYIDNNPAAVAMFDREMRYLAVSPRWLQDYGLTAEIIGRSHYKIIPEIPDRWKEVHRRSLAGAVEKLEADRFERADGSVQWLKWEVRPWPDSTGAIGGVIMYSEDITEQKLAQTRLVEQAAMLNQAQDAILVRDLDNGIRYWNQGAERLYGWSAQEVVGRSVKDLLYRGDTSQLAQALKAVVEKGEWVGEIRQFAKDGRELVIDAHWTLIRDEHGQPKSVLAINTDITEKKKLEAQFLRAQRLESLGTLAGGIAHDLNNILSPVLMGTQMLQMRLTDADSQRWLEVMRGSLERGAEMVKQILLFARGVQGEHVPLQLKHLIRDIIRMLSETFPKSIAIKCSLAEELALVTGDATHLQQVLMNLCVNARDAMPNGGTLLIETAHFTVDTQYAALSAEAHPGPYVAISLSDTGSGIPAAIKDKIFDPFFTTKELGKGTGLGLSTVLGLVKSHQGFIKVDSEIGRGTKFTVYLPAYTTGPAASPSLNRPAMPAGHGELILVVDDEAAIREITRITLETFGYRVLTASDGIEALLVYAQHPDQIQAVLTDMMMPNMDGPTAISALKKLNPQLKVIASSGLAEQGKLQEMATRGVTHFLPKPYTAERLLQELAALLRTG